MGKASAAKSAGRIEESGARAGDGPRRAATAWRAAVPKLMHLARSQHGVVARQQVIGLGVSPHTMDRRLSEGWLVPLYRGVYRVGPMETPRTREMAAVLACGNGAVISHRSALVLWNLMPAGSRHGAAVNVAARQGYREHRGIRFHRLRTLRPDEVTTREGVPVTTPERALLDSAGILPLRSLEKALAEALATKVTTRAAVLRILDRHPRARGGARLRSLLTGGRSPARTRSQAEEIFLRRVRKAGLPDPETNVWIGEYEVDFYWRAYRLVAEVDGYAFHGSKARFERDRRRDADLAAGGITCLRFTWHQLQNEPEWVLVRLVRALDGRDPAGSRGEELRN